MEWQSYYIITANNRRTGSRCLTIVFGAPRVKEIARDKASPRLKDLADRSIIAHRYRLKPLGMLRDITTVSFVSVFPST